MNNYYSIQWEQCTEIDFLAESNLHLYSFAERHKSRNLTCYSFFNHKLQNIFALIPFIASYEKSSYSEDLQELDATCVLDQNNFISTTSPNMYNQYIRYINAKYTCSILTVLNWCSNRCCLGYFSLQMILAQNHTASKNK